MNLHLDTLPEKDLLGREKFADQIVKSLKSSFDSESESMVIGVCGPWGSGKTTLMNYIEEAIIVAYANDEERYRVVHFNPWAKSGLDDLQRELLQTLIHALEKVNWKENVKTANETFKKYLRYLNYLKFVKHVHPVAKNIVDAVDEYNKKVSVASVEDLKQKINTLIKAKGIRLYIMIDDLDRLEPNEVGEIFRTVKLSANFTNSFFLIAYDKKVVVQSLKNQFGENAEHYLEKIVQVDFVVPEILEEQIEEIFFEKLRMCLGHVNVEYKEQDIFRIWKHRGLREYFRTLRDVKRYLNSLSLSLPNIGANINIGDFISLEAIKVFDFKGYEFLYKSFLQIQRKAIWSSVSFDQGTIGTFENPTTQSLLNYLFIEGNNLYPLGESINKKRLKDREFFERYFTLYIPSSDITEDMLRQYLTAGSNKIQLLDESLRNGKMKNLLRRLADSELRKSFEIDDFSVFTSLVRFWDSKEEDLTSEIDEQLWQAYFNLAGSVRDKFVGAKTAISELIMQENQYQAMKLVFNYFILLINDEKRSDLQFRGDIETQLAFFLPELKEGLVKNLNMMGSGYFWKISIGKGNFVCNLAINSFAKYSEGEYIKNLEKSISDANVLAFIIRYNLLLGRPKEGSAMLNLKNKGLLFPNNLFDLFLGHLEKMRPGALDEEDQAAVNLFLATYRKEFGS